MQFAEASAMTAEQSVREGNLDEGLRQLQSQVRSDPSNAAHRVFLFQLLAVLGQWDRALTQLNVAGELDAASLAMVQAYRDALQCEVLRDGVFAGKRAPLVFGEPAPWVALLIEALRLDAAGNAAAAAASREAAFDAAPATRGTIDGAPFEWIADADPRLGPTLEAVVNGRYYWIPFSRIARIELEAPVDLRDRVWAPATLTWSNEGQAAGFIPTRYAGTVASADSGLLLARRTEWVEPDAGGAEVLARATGQRMFATDANEYALLDVRRIELEAAADHG
jgi:type VI secretion system protein ImpE